MNRSDYFTVICIKVDAFDSRIIAERHFRNANEARFFASFMNKKYTVVISQLSPCTLP